MREPCSLEYSDSGSGLAVVLIHGFGLSREIWRHQIEALSRRFRVVALDLCGHGNSPVTQDNYLMEDLGRDVLALLDKLGIERAAVAGHSMGGYVTLALQGLAPQRVAGVGMTATQARADTAEARENRFRLGSLLTEEGTEAVVRFFAPRLFAPTVTSADPAYSLAASIIRSTSPAALRGSLLGMADRPDHRPSLPQIKVPSLVLAGEADQLMPLDRAEEMAALIPDCFLVKLPETGHMPMLERPEEVSAAMEAWLDRILNERGDQAG